MQHSASATATPPSATSWAERSAPDRTPWRTAACSALTAPRSAAGSAPSSALAAQLGQLGADLGRLPRGADQRDRVALAREAQPAGARRVGQLADHADDRRRVDRPLAALVVERDVAAHHRHAERAAGVAEPGHGARELPRDVRLLGVAEVQAVGQARAARRRRTPGWPSTRARPRPRRRTGSTATRRPLPSIETAIAPPESSVSTAASACSGRRTVREPTRQSYCSNAHRREARLALPSSASSVPPASRPASSTALGRAGRSASPAAAARGRRPGTRRPARSPAGRRPAPRRRTRAAARCRSPRRSRWR